MPTRLIKLTQTIEAEGPQEFSMNEILGQVDLFTERSALSYTPTKDIPSDWIGSGPIDIVLPIATPSYYEYMETRYYQTPKFWVDLLQRATGKLRWVPMNPVSVEIIRFDTSVLPYHAIAGTKALQDALKLKTSGRSDGRWLHYFGAILDDSPSHVLNFNFSQELVPHSSEAKTRVIVKPHHG